MVGRQPTHVVLMMVFSLCASCNQDTAPTDQDYEDTETFVSQESGAVVVPLKDIWAFRMPGTRDIRLLEPLLVSGKFRELSVIEGQELLRQSLVRQIQRSLNDRPANGPKPSFVVQGSGAKALREAHSVLVAGKKPQQSFLAGSELSLVFFSYQASAYVHLEEAKIKGHSIRIEYRLQQHMTLDVTEHFAVIPLGSLPAGEVQVEIVWSDEAEHQDDPNNRIACESFSFTLTD